MRHLSLAYIDSGSGSLILQALAGGIAGIAVAARLYWRRLKRFFGRSDEPEESPRPRGATASQSRSAEPVPEDAVGRIDR